MKINIDLTTPLRCPRCRRAPWNQGGCERCTPSAERRRVRKATS